MRREPSVVLSLALGRPVTYTDFSWSEILEAARRERCAPLAWLRSASVIRAAAPQDVVEQWRAEAFSAFELAQLWTDVAALVSRTLLAVSVAPIILKGFPLSQRLYGDAMARPCADLDIFVPESGRAAAHQALLQAGWRWRIGTAPHEGGYELDLSDRSLTLEVHSSLLDDSLVAHLPFTAPRAAEVATGAGTVWAHDDEQLASFLATHLAKHSRPPLLWLVDFAQLWRTLDDSGRDRAWKAARAARAHRYLRWAVRQASALEESFHPGPAQRSASAPTAVLARVHPVVRVALLSANLRDAARAIAGWLVPLDMRGKPGRILSELFARPFVVIARRLRRRLRPHMSTAAKPDTARAMTRGLRVDSSDLARIARDLTAQGSSFWIRASGSSMHPTITDGTAVRLAPLPSDRAVVVGEVLLAAVGSENLVLHRVRRVTDDRLVLQGDANVRPDTSITSADVLAVADAIRVGGLTRPIPPRPRNNARAMLRAAVGRWARERPTLGGPAIGSGR